MSSIIAQITSTITDLTTKESQWNLGPLPLDTLQAFQELHSHLSSKPVVDYHQMNRHYNLITNASIGNDKKPNKKTTAISSAAMTDCTKPRNGPFSATTGPAQMQISLPI